MSEYTGYHGNSLEFLKVNKISIGDSVKILADITYSGIVMPRYEHSDDKHIVLKLKSGYNIGLEIKNIEKVEKKLSIEKNIETKENIENGLKNVLKYSWVKIVSEIINIYSNEIKTNHRGKI